MEAIGKAGRAGMPRRAAIAMLATLAATVLVAPASAKDLKLNRTVKSGVETRIAYSGAWDSHCKMRPSTVTISRQPSNGKAFITPGVQTLPPSTPGSGATSCAGAKVDSNQIMYRSNDGFHGTDVVGYRNDTAGIDATVTIKVE